MACRHAFPWKKCTLHSQATIACGSLPPRKCNYVLHKYDVKTEMVELVENHCTSANNLCSKFCWHLGVVFCRGSYQGGSLCSEYLSRFFLMQIFLVLLSVSKWGTFSYQQYSNETTILRLLSEEPQRLFHLSAAVHIKNNYPDQHLSAAVQIDHIRTLLHLYVHCPIRAYRSCLSTTFSSL